MNLLCASANRLSACGRALRPWLWRTLLPAAVLDPSGPASPAVTVRKESEPPRVPRVLYPSRKKWRMNVDREHVKGAADKVKGAIKDSAGKVTGDKKLQTEGKIDKAKGSAHNLAGDVKDAARDASKTADD